MAFAPRLASDQSSSDQVSPIILRRRGPEPPDVPLIARRRERLPLGPRNAGDDDLEDWVDVGREDDMRQAASEESSSFERSLVHKSCSQSSRHSSCSSAFSEVSFGFGLSLDAFDENLLCVTESSPHLSTVHENGVHRHAVRAAPVERTSLPSPA